MWKEYTKLSVLQKIERNAILDKNKKKHQTEANPTNSLTNGPKNEEEDDVVEVNISIS